MFFVCISGHMHIFKRTVTIYDKRDDFNFEVVNFPFLDGDVSRYPSYGVNISQLICLREYVLMLMI